MWSRGAGLVAAVALAIGLAARAAPACDVCAVYSATEMRELRSGWRVGVGEQLGRFTTRQLDGEEVANPGERLTSSITQVLVGYGFTPGLGVQLNLPVVSRTFRRLEDGRLRRDDETGIADLALVGQWTALRIATEESVLRLSLLGGVEFPTGDTDRLAEELAPRDDHAASRRLRLGRRLRPLHAGAPHETPGPGGVVGGSAIHGHDLALGSGSYDGIVGATLFWSRRRFYATATGQYAIRSEGDFDYRYANDLVWSGGPGVFPFLTHAWSLGVQALLTGETKGNDRQAGRKLDDTALTALYVGPGVSFTWGSSLAADIAADLPVVQRNTSLQIVADYRLRGGLTWRF